MIESINNGISLHTTTAKEMFGDLYKKDIHRPIGKKLNFSIAYGAGENNISESLGVDFNTAKSYINKFYNSYPNVSIYFKNKYKESRANNFIIIDNITNRKFFITKKFRNDEIIRKCQNYPNN